MRITNARKDETGQWQFDMSLSEAETSFLVELSVTSLIKVGMIRVEDHPDVQDIDLSLQTAPSSAVVQ